MTENRTIPFGGNDRNPDITPNQRSNAAPRENFPLPPGLDPGSRAGDHGSGGEAQQACPFFVRPGPGEDREWPSARYFQVHFEHLYSALTALQRELENQRRVLFALQRRWEGRRKTAAPGDFGENRSADGQLVPSPDSNH